MNNKYLVVSLILLLALFTLACQSVGSFELPGFLQGESQTEDTQEFPKLRVGSVRPVENTGIFIVPIETISNAIQRKQSVLPPLPLEPVVSISTDRDHSATVRRLVDQLVPPILNERAEEYILHKIVAPNLISDVLKIPTGKPQQINSFHLSTEQLETIKISVNGQPLVASEEISATQTFPANLLDVSLCTDYQWQNTEVGPLLLCAKVEKANVFLPSQSFPTQKMMLSLVVTGTIPGTYNLGFSTADAAGREQEIIQQIEVNKPTP